MKKMSRWLAAALAVVMCLGLAACGKDFDAAGYTKSVLDANYHGEYKEYAKFRDISEKEAEKEVEDNRVDLVESELAEIGEVSDEIKSTYLEKTKEIEKLAKYEVKEAKKQDDDSFIVTVEVTPSEVYMILETQAEEVAQEMFDAGDDPSADVDTFVELLFESIDRAIENNTYGEATTIEVKVTPDKDGAYGLADSEMEKLEEALFPGE